MSLDQDGAGQPQDYAYAQPSLVAHKRRKLELRAGLPSHRGRPGKAPGTRCTPFRRRT